MHVQGGRVSNPTCASPTLHTAPLPQIPSILTLIQDCTHSLTLSHLLHLRQTTTSHTSSCHSHRIAHAERVEHRSYIGGKPWMEIHRYRMSDVWGDKIRGVAELYIVLKHYIMTPCLLEMGNTYHDQARVSETFASSTMLSPSSGTVAFAVQLTPDSNLVSVTSTSKFLSEGSSVAVRVRPASSSRS